MSLDWQDPEVERPSDRGDSLAIPVVVALVATVVTAGVTQASALVGQHLAMGLDDHQVLVVGAVTAVAINLAADLTFGVVCLAAAVVVSARLAGVPAPPFWLVARNLWGVYAVFRVAQTIGAQFILPGLAITFAAAFLIDPIARAEGSSRWGPLPTGGAALALAAITLTWTGVYAAYALLALATREWGTLPRFGVDLTYGLLALGAWLAWCAAWHRSRRTASVRGTSG